MSSRRSGKRLLLILLTLIALPAYGAAPWGPMNAPDPALVPAGTSCSEDLDEIGGDDVLIAAHNIIESAQKSIDIAENGDIYVAISANDSGTYDIYVYRSQDGGTTWALWGTRTNGRMPSLHVAEGTVDRVYLAYSRPNTTNPFQDSSLLVAYSPLSVSSAFWTETNVMSQSGFAFVSADLSSSEMNFEGYILYLAAARFDGGLPRSVVVTRSVDFGATWEPFYPITPVACEDGHFERPSIRYGSGGVVHCAYTRHSPCGTPAPWAATFEYRRALNFAAGGIAAWQAPLTLAPEVPGYVHAGPRVAATHGGNNRVVIFHDSFQDTIGFLYGNARSSADAGVTWPAGDTVQEGCWYLPHVLSLPANDGFALASLSNGRVNLQKAAGSTPLVWSDYLTFSDFAGAMFIGSPDLDYNLVEGNRIGVTWLTRGTSGEPSDSLFFDAEWRRDAGFPNLEAGFPVSVPGSVTVAPILGELDGDPQSEIVFGTVDGSVYAINHDGTTVPGWPVTMAAGFPGDTGTIAMGDINGDGDSEIVAGSLAGIVYAWDVAGVLLPGFPADLFTGKGAFVSIASITTPTRQIVATSGPKLYVLKGDGTTASPFRSTFVSDIKAPAAIGDVDGDGDPEIVIAQQGYVNVIRNSGTNQAFRTLPGKTTSNAPTLGDLNEDGDLEIVVPTEQGDVYVLNPDGTNFGSWPLVTAEGLPLTTVALAQIRGLTAPELIFNVEDPAAPKTYAYYSDKVLLGGFPRSGAPGWYMTAPPIVDFVEGSSSDVITASRAGVGYVWDNFAAPLPGWPKTQPGSVQVAGATGDVDDDGLVEVIFGTLDPPSLVVYDVGSLMFRPPTNINRWWPMEGYNAQRTGCLACDEQDYVSGVADDAPSVEAVRFLAPSPNPSFGSVTLQFEIAEPAVARLTVFDVSGRVVKRLLKSELPAGSQSLVWDGRGEEGGRVVPGVYYARLSVEGIGVGRTLDRKIVMVH